MKTILTIMLPLFGDSNGFFIRQICKRCVKKNANSLTQLVYKKTALVTNITRLIKNPYSTRQTIGEPEILNWAA